MYGISIRILKGYTANVDRMGTASMTICQDVQKYVTTISVVIYLILI